MRKKKSIKVIIPYYLQCYENKWILIFVLFQVLSCQLSSCRTPVKRVVAKHENGNVAEIYELPNKNDTLNYTLKLFYPDGNLKKVASVVNGQYTGVVTTYFPSGKIYQLDSLTVPCNVIPGDCDESLIRYNENGSLSQRFMVKAGHFEGLSEHYDSKGKLVKTYYLINDTVKNGEYKEFYDNGNVLRKATYYMDTLIGYEYIFKENGDTLRYYSYHQGHVDFPYKKWLEDGNTLYGVRLKGKEVLWTWRKANGKILKQQVLAPAKSGYAIPN